MHVEEEKNPAQEVEQLEEDAKRKKSNMYRGKGMHQEEHTTCSIQHGIEPKEQHRTGHQDIPIVGVSSQQGKKKARAERSSQGVQHTQVELAIVMPKYPRE